MRRIWLIPFLTLVACAHKEQDVSLRTYNVKEIVAFGDSITFGTGAQKGYVDRIADRTGAHVTNFAVGSSTIAGFGSTIALIRANQVPTGSTVIYLPGMNDVLNNGDDPAKLQDFLTNLKEALDLWEGQGIEAYVGMPIKLDYNGLMYAVLVGKPCTAYTPTLYARSVLELIKAGSYKHIHAVDTHNNYQPDDSNNDGIHPNDIGAAIIAQIFLDVIK